MSKKSYNIMIGGEAGQGLVTVGNLLSKALVRHGYHIVVTQSYLSRIRGGHNMFTIRVSTEEIACGRERIDLLVALDADTVSRHRQTISEGGLIVADEAFAIGDNTCVNVPYKEFAGKKYENVAALGVAAALLGLSGDICSKLLEDTFAKKGEGVLQENRQAFSKAFDWTGDRRLFGRGLDPVSNIRSRLMINGNEAIALGAISSGLKFYSFYPMTPSTSLGLTLASYAKEMGLIVEQAEGEIAAINMAIGASFAGAPSMVATSGGGFALMVEGVSLAAMTETPIVIVVAQRPGPATGLPTRTEQADLEMVLHAGHGEFPRAIFAPGSAEQCFYLTRKAFEISEEAQSPAFILTDQYLADSYRAVEPFDMSDLPAVHTKVKKDFSGKYLRHAITDDGVSPRLFPGKSENLVVTDSDEHTEDGHLTEDLEVRKAMVRKRLRKGEIIKSKVVAPEYAGPDSPDLLLLDWGSSKGVVDEAASELCEKGMRVATLHFSQVWPLNASQFMKYLESTNRVICIEGNATAQFARLLRRETGFKVTGTILRFDGLPFTPEWIIKELNA